MGEAAPFNTGVLPGAAERSEERHAGLGPWSQAGLLAGAALYLYANLFTLGGVPFLLGGDQVFFWLYGLRLLDGERVYRDFLQRTPPGADLIYAAAFRLFGSRIWVPNLVVLVLGIALCWLCFHIAQSFLTRWQALLAASAVVLVYGRIIMGTHHWFSEMAVLGAVAVLLRGKGLNRIAIAGIMLGVATFITQTRGPSAAAGITGYLLWERWRTQTPWRECLKRLTVGFACFLLTTIALYGYFIGYAGRLMRYWLVVYVWRYMAYYSLSLLTPGAQRHFSLLAYLLFDAAMLTAYAFSIYCGWRASPASTETYRRMLLTFMGVGTAIEVGASPNWLRVFCVSAPAILIAVWALMQAKRISSFFAYLLGFGIIAAGLVQTIVHHRGDWAVVVRTPAGITATTSLSASKLQWIGEHTRPGDYFFQAPWPGVYLPLGLRDPVYTDGVGPFEETRPEMVTRCVRELEAKRVRYVLWTPALNAPPDAQSPEGYHLTPLRDYVHGNYRLVYRFADNDEIWERR